MAHIRAPAVQQRALTLVPEKRSTSLPASIEKIPRPMFDRRDHELIRIVNSVLGGGGDDAYTRRLYYPYFHAQGIKEMAESKGLRIAYAPCQ